MEDDIYERFLISKNNIILEVNGEFLDLIGYSESELVGKTLVEAGKLLRTDSQVDLEEIADETPIFIFTKKLVAIEGIVSCGIIDNRDRKIFSFKKDSLNCINQIFSVSSQLSTSRGDGVAIFNCCDLVLMNSNQNYLNFLRPPYNKKTNSIGKNLKEIFLEEIYNLFNKMKSHIIKTGNPFYGEEMLFNINSLGETYWNISLVPILENEKIKYLMLYTSNETEKVLNREALKQRNEELETIVENISDEILIFDKDFNVDLSSKNVKGNLTFNNPSVKVFNNLYDFKDNTLMYDEDNQLIPYEELPFKRVSRGEFISNFFLKSISDEEVVYRDVSGYPTYDKDGNFSRGILILKDIEDRIEKEESRLMKSQEEVLTKIVESMELEYVRCTYPELEIISLNGKAMDKLKKINNEIKSDNCPIGKHCFELFPLNVERKIESMDFHLIEKGKYSYIDYQNYIVDGEERFFKTVNEPIFGLDNKIIEVIFITKDITEEVQERNEIKETLEMQNQVFATISHELKTPLNVIFSAAQLIERDLKGETSNIDKEEIGKKISIVKQNCYRFTKLINNIIDLSRMESGFYRLKFSNVNIVEIVEDIVDSVKSYVENSGLRIIFDTEVEEKIMAIDLDKMERIILNLVSNAVKFSPKGETIYINIEDKGDYVLVLVRDCGVGIGAKHLNTIFDRYKKVDNSLYKNAEGSGLGLSLVEIIVKSVGGEISVESELGKGSIFTMKIPVNILDESEVIENMEDAGARAEQLKIEFSDTYTK